MADALGNFDPTDYGCPAWVKELSGDMRIHDLGEHDARATAALHRMLELEDDIPSSNLVARDLIALARKGLNLRPVPPSGLG